MARKWPKLTRSARTAHAAVPAVLVQAGGRDQGYTVKHHDWLIIPPVRRPREVWYFVVADQGTEEYEAHWIDVGLISEVIVPPAPAPAQAESEAEGNGE